MYSTQDRIAASVEEEEEEEDDDDDDDEWMWGDQLLV